MKIIDLLNKIANGEEVPKKIKITDIDDGITKHYNFFYDEDDQEYKDDALFPLGARLILDRVLNKKVKILDKIEEEKKIPEKLETYKDRNNDIFLDDLCYKYMPIHKDSLSFNEQVIVDKLNEVLDYIKNKGE